MSGIYLDTEPATRFSLTWWDEAEALMHEISTTLHSLTSQFERTLAYRTKDASEYDVRSIKEAVSFLISIKRDVFPVSRWVNNGRELDLSEIPPSEQAALNAYAKKFDEVITHQHGEVAIPLYKLIVRITGRSNMLSEQAKTSIWDRTTYLHRCLKDARDLFMVEAY